ncbi:MULTISPECIES: hypothetical protein [unclassified Bradyrhizobium]|uniref:hypothetical protein n=1 Tax=unclassified Bradyrhizobium TaxID=2631580 RepID=UPI0029167655|nr:MULTISPECIES: hypothetical protein [unclassified Bradyrhizobium]
MSLLGFDAIGRQALGELPHGQQAVVLTTGSGSFAMGEQGAGFSIAEAAVVGSIALTGVTATFRVAWPETVGAFASAGVAAPFKVSEAAVTGALALNGASVTTSQDWPAPGTSIAVTFESAPLVPAVIASPGAFALAGFAANEPIVEVAAGASVAITFNSAELVRTGYDYEVTLGGVGHYRLEMERAKQLARITRKAPPPVDLRSAPKFEPIGRPPIAPRASAADLSAVQAQRIAAQMQAAQAAKKRRELEAVLLLAS